MTEPESDLRFLVIGEAAKSVELWEDNRKVVENRLRALNQRYGDNPLAQLSHTYSELSADLGSCQENEAAAIAHLEWAVAQHSTLANWIDDSRSAGVGYKTVGRVLGLLGDPRVRPTRTARY